MNIRAATINDVPALNIFVNSAYRGESSKKGWTTEADLLDGVRTTEPALREMINRMGSVILLAEERARLNACVFLEKQGDVLYLGMLTVHPELQGKGLGAEMMKRSEEKARAAGCNKIRMTVITVRKELIAFYEKKGYRDTGERKPFPNDPAFGIQKQPLEFMVMEKSIT